MRRSGIRVVFTAVLAVTLLSCTDPAVTPPASAPASAPEIRHLQVVAHQDDDILFMNPDVSAAIRSSRPTMTVYLTAGEANVADTAGYAAKRQAGTRAAYARMAGAPDDWRAEPLELDRDHRVELYTLKARPSVQVVFVNLPENADTKALGGARALVRLWQDRSNAVRVRALKPNGGVEGVNCVYDRQTVIDTLVGIFARFRPTMVRSQDSAPDRRYTGNWVPFHDHPDHVMAALFTREAAQLYQLSGASPRFVSVSYRDYNVDEAPINLSPAQQKDKLDTFAAYVPHDDQVSMGEPYNTWARRTYYRWPRGVSWADTGRSGRGEAFAVLAGRLVRWSEAEDGRWTGPTPMADAGGPLAPTVSVARQHVFARRLDTNEILVLAEGATAWTSLGNPNRGGATESEVGTPTASAVDGGVAVFVRNGGGGVSMLASSDGRSWPTTWTDLGGSDVQDGLAVAVTGTGWDLFAPTRQAVLRWHRRGGPPALDPGFRAPRPAGPLTATGIGGDRAALAYRIADTADIAVVRTDDARPAMVLPNPGGLGAPALARTERPDQLVVFARDDGGVSAAVSAGDGFGRWTRLADQVAESPAVLGSDGRLVLLALGLDGRLLANRQVAPGGAFSGWGAVGS